MILGIYGSGGLGREIYDLALRININKKTFDGFVFIDDISPNRLVNEVPTITFEEFTGIKNSTVVIGVGEPKNRELIFNRVKSTNCSLGTLIDPTSIISSTANIGEGCIVSEFVTIHANVSLAINSLIQPQSVIGHDINIGAHAVISAFCAPGGNVRVGDRAFIGMHCSIMQGLTVGNDAVVGMGSVVFKDVPAHSVVVGNPARITKGNDDHKVFNITQAQSS